MLDVIDGRRDVMASVRDVINAALDDTARRAQLPALLLEELHLDSEDEDVISRIVDVITARQALDDAARLLG